MSHRPGPLRLYLTLSFVTIVWTLNFIIAKVALREISPLALSGVRTAMAALFMLPIYFMTGPHRFERRELPGLLAIGTLGVGLNQLFFVLGLSRTSVAHSAIIIAMTPLVVLSIAWMRGQERVTKRKLAGLLMAFTGVALLQIAKGTKPGSTGVPTVLGDLLTLAGASVFAMFTVFGKEYTQRHGPVTVNAVAYTSSAVLLLPLTLWDASNVNWQHVSGGAWLAVAYMAGCSSVMAYLLFYYALTHVPASRVAAFSYLQPLLATLIAIPLLNEYPAPSALAVGALVLAGVYLTQSSA